MNVSDLRLHHASFAWAGGRDILRDQTGCFVLEGVVALCGLNGCGKSTFLNLLAGAISPTEGRIEIEGEVVVPSQRLEDLDQSPGQAQKARLASLLRQDPGLLILDEPTNHLDHDGLRTLERSLSRRRDPTILVSHDRDLLDRLVKSCLWLEGGVLFQTKGGFTQAWTARQDRLRENIVSRERSDAELRALHRRLQSARESAAGAARDRSAGSRMKDVHDSDQRSMGADFKFRSADTRLGRDQGRLREEIARRESRPSMEVHRDTLRDVTFPWDASRASGKLSLPAGEIEALDGSRIAHGGLRLDARSRVRLAGANGSGKSTLLEALARLGRPGVFHLPQEPRREDDVLLLEGIRAMPPGELGRILSLAAAFGASGEALRATASPSPGEARKLRLATGLCSPSWILLLDEPTNHLDAASIERLQEALVAWPGALLLSTHDERLAKAVAGETWTIEDRRVRQA